MIPALPRQCSHSFRFKSSLQIKTQLTANLGERCTFSAVAEASEEYGAVAVRGVITYDLSIHNAEHLELRNVLQPQQYILIHIDSLRGLISILNKADRRISHHRE